MSQPEKDANLVDALTRKAKNNRLLAWVFVIGLVVIALASFGDAVVSMLSLPKRVSASVRETEENLANTSHIVTEPRSDLEYWRALLCEREASPVLDTNQPLSTLTDQEQIRLLIEAEGQAAVQKDVFRHVSLFRKDALFREPSGEWSGCEAITKRALTLFRQIRFLLIQEEIVELEIQGRAATATTRHKEEYVIEGRRHGAVDRRVFVLTAQTKWSFVKDEGIWRIHTFVSDARSMPPRSLGQAVRPANPAPAADG